MVRRFLLIAVLATLAVALPATAQDDPYPWPLPPECSALEACGEPLCPPSGACEALDCPTLATCSPGCSLLETCEGEARQLFSCEVVQADPSGSSDEPVTIDRDGCVRAIIRHVLGWPPAPVAYQLNPPDSAVRLF